MQLKKVQLTLLYACTALNFCLTAKGEKVILVEKNSTTALSTAHVTSFYEQQGESIIILTYNSLGIAETANEIIYLSAETLIGKSNEAIDCSNLPPFQIPLFISPWPGFEYFRKADAFLLHLHQQLKTRIAAADAFWQIDLYRKRTQLYLSIVALGKKVAEKEYSDLVGWYQKEYEVLPLWYKRLGHIIKVVYGKRSFKSLFQK